MLKTELQTQETQNPTVEKVTKRYITPSVNIYETEEDTRIILDMPGVDQCCQVKKKKINHKEH